jgi:hypothetical protein
MDKFKTLVVDGVTYVPAVNAVKDATVHYREMWAWFRDELNNQINTAKSLHRECESNGLSINMIETEGALRGVLGVLEMVKMIEEAYDVSPPVDNIET